MWLPSLPSLDISGSNIFMSLPSPKHPECNMNASLQTLTPPSKHQVFIEASMHVLTCVCEIFPANIPAVHRYTLAELYCEHEVTWPAH